MSTIKRNAPKPLVKPALKKALPREVAQLAKNKKATVTKNADGSVTRRRDTAKTSKELTTSEGKLLETKLEYKKSASTARGDSESTFTKQTDMLGRASTGWVRDSTNKKGVNTVDTKAVDVFNVEKQTKTVSKQTVKGNTTESAVKYSSKDSVGNRATSSDVTRVTEQGKTVVTTNDKRASGSDLTTRSSTTYEDGKFTLADGADWSKNKSFEKSYLKETEYDASKFIEKGDKAGNFVGKALKFLGLDEKWSSEVSPDRVTENTLAEGKYGSVTSRVGVTGGQSLAIDGESIRAEFNRDARAGVYAQSSGAVEGRYGSASYDARAAAEAYATVDAQGRIDANGLDARVNARVGAKVEVEINAEARSRSVRFLGTDLDASVQAHGRASAEVSAEVTGQVSVTRNPPRAIAQGTAGASAVAKAEGEIRASAGPFSVSASGYVSAGAEARATGVIGYEDGKLKLGGSLGAALGVGAGGGVQVEVDVRQIGQMAHNAADVNGDGKLGLADVGAAATKTASRVAGWFGF